MTIQILLFTNCALYHEAQLQGLFRKLAFGKSINLRKIKNKTEAGPTKKMNTRGGTAMQLPAGVHLAGGAVRAEEKNARRRSFMTKLSSKSTCADIATVGIA